MQVYIYLYVSKLYVYVYISPILSLNVIDIQ